MVFSENNIKLKKNLNNSKVTKYAPIMLNVTQKVLFNNKKENQEKSNFVNFLTKSLFSTDYHKNHKTQNNRRFNTSTKMISR